MVLVDKVGDSYSPIGKGVITKQWAEFLAKSNPQRYALGEIEEDKGEKEETVALQEDKTEDVKSESATPKRKGRRPKQSSSK